MVWFACVASAVPARFYVGHSIYKGKAALTVEPKAPEFTALDVCFIRSTLHFVLGKNHIMPSQHDTVLII